MMTEMGWQVNEDMTRDMTGEADGMYLKVECGNRISSANFYIVFHSNYRSILRSFWDITTGQATDDGRTNTGKYKIATEYNKIK